MDKLAKPPINEQWRLCFMWQAGDAYNVQIIIEIVL